MCLWLLLDSTYFHIYIEYIRSQGSLWKHSKTTLASYCDLLYKLNFWCLIIDWSYFYFCLAAFCGRGKGPIASTSNKIELVYQASYLSYRLHFCPCGLTFIQTSEINNSLSIFISFSYYNAKQWTNVLNYMLIVVKKKVWI